MRRQTKKHGDNINLFNRLGRNPLRANAVTPDILVGPIWLNDDEPTAVEIIELNSSNEAETSLQDPNRDNMSHTWSYVNNDEMQQIEDSYKLNKKARERRRKQNENILTLPSAYNAAKDGNDCSTNFANEFYTNHSKNHVDDKLAFNHQMNCFTIINKHFVDSDTSTDGEYSDVGIITSSDLIMDGSTWEPNNNNLYNEEIITYDADLDQETRTIWIYSFKNKHLLADDDFEAINMPSKEVSSSSTYSTDSSGEHTTDKCTPARRIGSPTPPTYIPRLDLSLVPTLSTVTEISERNMQPTPNESIKSLNRNIKKPTNNWFISESAKLEGTRPIRKLEKSTNIINWMGLSPRERRRVLKDKSSSDTWVGSRLHLAELCKDQLENHGDQTHEILQNDGLKVQVDVEVHVDLKGETGVTTVAEMKSAGAVVKSEMDDANSLNRIQYADAVTEDLKDRGDHDVKLVVAPTIRLTHKSRKALEITDPIEKLENSKWIRETKEEIETNVYDYVLDKSESTIENKTTENSIDHIWMKNTVPFLKPSQWTEFVPIAESPVSYHLSLGSIIEERQTWFRRFINMFKCCK